MTALPTQASIGRQPWRRLLDDDLGWLMPAAGAMLALAAAGAAGVASTWPFVHDAPLIHYFVFLMDRGRAPYRDIIDMNLPGSYMTDWLVMHTLGVGAFGWWLWDLLLGLAAIGASAWIAGRGRRGAGIAAGALTYTAHLADGAWDLGQRDWEVAALLLIAAGCVFEAIRKDRPAWMAGFMAACGFAASIKPPTAAIALVLLVGACWLERRGSAPGSPGASRVPWGYILWSAVGGLLPTALVAAFLLRWGIVGDFLEAVRGLTPWYASLKRVGAVTLIGRAFPQPALLFGGAIAYGLGRGWRDWRSNMLVAASIGGVALFIVQGKGWTYHRYTEAAFVSLWAMLELDRALKERGPVRAVAVFAIAATIGVVAPRLLTFELGNTYPMNTIVSLQNDLSRLGGASLSDHIQCLDVTRGGCLNVLYRLNLVQSTGYVSDFYLFPEQGNAVTARLQDKFLSEIRQKPPRVIVLSSHAWPSDQESYDQLSRWPAFQAMLARDYRMVRELPIQPGLAGYRLYLLSAGARPGAAEKGHGR